MRFYSFPLLFLLLFGTFSLTACQSSDQKNGLIVDQIPQVRKVGFLKSLGSVPGQQGTHILQQTQDETLFLKSVAINLGDEKYINKYVEVRGVVSKTETGKDLMEVMTIDVLTEIEVPQTQEVLSFETVTNDTYGIRLKVRSDFVQNDEDKILSFIRELKDENPTQEVSQETSEKTKKQMMFQISYPADAEGKTLQQYLKITKEDNASLSAIGLAKTVVGAETLIGFKRNELGKETYFLDVNQKITKVVLDFGSEQLTPVDKNILYEMLASLTFGVSTPATQETLTQESALTSTVEIDDSLEKTASAEVKKIVEPEVVEFNTQELEKYNTFKSESFNFSLMYPKNLYFGSAKSEEKDVIRRYDFGYKPLEEQPASLHFDLISGDLPSGTSINVNGKSAVKVLNGDGVTLYLKGAGSRVYRFAGASGDEQILIKMAGTLQE